MNPKNERTAKTGDTTAARTESVTEATEAQDRAATIARLAYEKWQGPGRPEGDDQRDWLDAEQEVLAAGGSRANRGVAIPKSGVTS